MKIGIEVHCQLMTKSKIFCSCPTTGKDEPNTRVCDICCGLPGSKPVLNRNAFEMALKVALSLDFKINKETFFSRKSYFYPDLAKNIQITQYELPLAEKGVYHKIKLTRLHLEEDPGALIHKQGYSLVDYNRSGIPLIELVTEPDFKSSVEVRRFLNKLITLLEYLEVFDRKSEASLKADLNISTNGPKVEIKNVTGMKEIEKALNYEFSRQNKEKVIKQETRGWDADKGITILQRVKESEDDYGYISETDLPMFEISKNMIDEIKKEIPELADEKITRFIKKYKLKEEDAAVLASNRRLANLYEDVVKKVNPSLTAKFFRRDLLKQLYYHKKTIEDIKFDSKELIELLSLLSNNKITAKTATEVMIALISKKISPNKYIKSKNLFIKSGSGELEKLCVEAIGEHKKAVEDYKNGENNALNFVVGQIMRKTKGTADASKVRKILEKLIKKES